jgi:hypothetical protein
LRRPALHCRSHDAELFISGFFAAETIVPEAADRVAHTRCQALFWSHLRLRVRGVCGDAGAPLTKSSAVRSSSAAPRIDLIVTGVPVQSARFVAIAPRTGRGAMNNKLMERAMTLPSSRAYDALYAP